MKFSHRLENLLEERNLTQKKLSTELHIAPSTLNGYLRKDREPDYDTLIKISEYFQVSTDFILGVTDIRSPYPPRECYDDREEELLGTYRELKPQEQDYLIKQAHIYHHQDLDTPLFLQKIVPYPICGYHYSIRVIPCKNGHPSIKMKSLNFILREVLAWISAFDWKI